MSLKIKDPPGWSQPLKIFLWYLRKQLILTLVLVLRSQLNPLLVTYQMVGSLEHHDQVQFRVAAFLGAC